MDFEETAGYSCQLRYGQVPHNYQARSDVLHSRWTVLSVHDECWPNKSRLGGTLLNDFCTKLMLPCREEFHLKS